MKLIPAFQVWVVTCPNEKTCLEHEWRTTGSVCLTSDTSSSVRGEIVVNCCRREVPGMKIIWTALNRSNIMKKSEIVILSNLQIILLLF